MFYRVACFELVFYRLVGFEVIFGYLVDVTELMLHLHRTS